MFNKMKYFAKLCSLISFTFLFSGFAYSQTEKAWSPYTGDAAKLSKDKGVARLSFPKEYKLFSLDLNEIKGELFTVTGTGRTKQSTVISLPNTAGILEAFEIFEASNFEPALQAQFPNIRAFSGKGITDKYARLKLSISPQGIQTMIFRTDKENEFIEPFSADHTVYAVFHSQRNAGQLPWRCTTQDQEIFSGINSRISSSNFTASSAGQLKTMRLVQSCNGEYANYFGATSAAQVGLVMAAYNGSLTRCNGVYENDLALHLNLIANTTAVIFYNPGTDPYSTLAKWNKELQQELTATIGSANYDIGHMFGASGGGGNAGCIGCVCEDPTGPNSLAKGSGITSPADGIPQGDNFDIDYVAHEVGHQLGANHTFSHGSEGTGVNKEVGSGITIMGYAGITNNDVTNHSIDIFHAASIAQIQANLAPRLCPITTSLAGTNATPVVAIVPNYTIPISTPFALTGSATDANAGDALTYCWEQNDDAGGSTGAASTAAITKTVGPNFITWPSTASPARPFPKLTSILAGSNTTAQVLGDAGMLSEALSSVGRTLNFRLTVRDNSPYTTSPTLKIGQTAFTDMVVTVSATSGPFDVTSPNTNVSYPQNSSQTITWNVNNTTAAPVSCANVKILFSNDGGLTFPTTLLASTPNDGSQLITIPAGATTTARIKVESISNIFFDISNTNFTVTAPLPAVYTFTGNGNWTVASNWSGSIIPPATLPSGEQIIINHTTGGVCSLNVTQIIAAGGILTINSGKNLLIPGALIRD